MHRGKRVVVFIPFGRELTVSVLFPYLLREHERGLLDEVMLCMNTDPWQEEDVEYAKSLAKRYRFVNLYQRPGPGSPRSLVIPNDWRRGYRAPKQMNTGRFYIYMQDRDTIYVRMDDDLIYVHPDALERLVNAELDRPEVLAFFPIIANNAVSSFLLQQRGKIPRDWGAVRCNAVDQNGWANPAFAERLHRMLLHAIREDTVDETFLWDESYQLPLRQQFSVSCFAIDGGEYADLDGVLDWDEEEHWLTQHRPGIVGKANHVLCSALVSHFTFFPQRDHLLRTDILDQYRVESIRVAEEVGDQKAAAVT